MTSLLLAVHAAGALSGRTWLVGALAGIALACVRAAVAYIDLLKVRAHVDGDIRKAEILARADVDRHRTSEEHLTTRYRIAAAGAAPSSLAEIAHELETRNRQVPPLDGVAHNSSPEPEQPPARRRIRGLPSPREP
jgi:hypothetical protein